MTPVGMQTSQDTTTQTMTWVGYALQVLGIFSAGVLWIGALIVAYIKVGDSRGTIYESHLRWQIATFWWAVFWFVMGCLLFVTLIGIVFAIPVWFGAAIWVVYRIIRGMVVLAEGRPLPM